jgi:hypothetical protein
MRRSLFVLSFAVAVAFGPGSSALAQAPSPAVHADFNGDGFTDLAVGVPGENLGTIADAGAVNVIYGSQPSGPPPVGMQFWHQNVAAVEGAAETNDQFGSSVAAGDFDNDGFADLAIGASGEGLGSSSNAGAVNVLYGTASGLSATGDQLWHQDASGVIDVAETGDFFGVSVAAGDFDGDGDADLAAGADGETSAAGALFAGAVNVLYGSSPNGLSATGNQFWHQDSSEVEGAAEQDDRLGRSLAAGDFKGDGADDLAMGASHEGVGSIEGAGAVNLLQGGPGSGLSAAGDQLWQQNSPGVVGVAEISDFFGGSLAADDFDGKGTADLAVGAPFEDLGVVDTGAVSVLYGSSAGGLSAAGDQVWHQDSPDVEGAAEPNDEFAFSLGSGDFDGEGSADLAAGVFGEDSFRGAVNVLYGGSATGISSGGDQLWDQLAITGSPGTAGDQFGRSVAGGDFDGSGASDLAVGVPSTEANAITDAGVVISLRGSETGLSNVLFESFSQPAPPGGDAVAETGDGFGTSVAAGGPHGGMFAE